MRRILLILAVLGLTFTSAARAQDEQVGPTRMDLVRQAGLPAAGHYTLGSLTYDGSQSLARLLLPAGSKQWANEIGLATTLISALAFEYDPLFNANQKAIEGVSEASIQLDGSFDLLERTASGIGKYLGDVLGAEFEIGFKVAAFLADFLATTEADRDLRR